MTGGGPFGLAAGQWTDDTAMALALAASLLDRGTLDEHDLMRRFLAWYRDGAYSCTDTCFDIGNVTRDALARFERTGEPLAGSADPFTAGNGAIMRLAPAVLAGGGDRDAVLRSRSWDGDAAIAAIARGDWRAKSRDAIRSSGYVVHTLEAAVWCVAQTDSFEDAIVLAVNLADDADTVGALPSAQLSPSPRFARRRQRARRSSCSASMDAQGLPTTATGSGGRRVGSFRQGVAARPPSSC